MINLKGKSAVVTGASGGLGAGIARVLAREGCRLALTCRSNVSGLDAVIEECRKTSPEVIPVQADISNLKDIERLTNTVVDTFGEVDFLINNAGITTKYSFLDITEAEYDEMYNINCKGTYFCSQSFARIMTKQNHGKIVNISSLTSRGAMRNFSAYSATKAAMNKYTEIMALELAPYHIQVNAIAAGWIPVGDELKMSDEKRAQAMPYIPAGRFGTPEDIGELAAFLVSDAGEYITGQTIFADGGQSCLMAFPTIAKDAKETK